MKVSILKEFFLPGFLSFFIHALFLCAFLLTLAGRVTSSSLRSVNFSSPSLASPSRTIPIELEGEWQEPFFKRKPEQVQPSPLSPEQPIGSQTKTVEFPKAESSGSDGYFSIGQVNQRPSIRVKVVPPYPEAAKRANIEGVVILQVDIDASGAVKKVVLVKGLGYGCDEAAIEAVKKSAWTPAYKDSRAVPVEKMPLKYNFHFDY